MAEPSPLFLAIIGGDAAAAKSATSDMLADGAKPEALLTHHLLPAMEEVGRRYECNEFFVPEMLIAARAMKASLALLRPNRFHSNGVDQPGAGDPARVAIGTVRGDLHDIGKNLVIAMLEGAGFDVIDLGVDVGPEKFLAAIKDKGVQVIALSALLTTTMHSMQVVIESLREAGLRGQVKVIVGGAPVTAEFAELIGADGYSPSAADVPGLLRQLLAGLPA